MISDQANLCAVPKIFPILSLQTTRGLSTRMPEIVLVEPEIPQNTGNIGRTCVATGSKLWLVKPFGFELTEKQLKRAGLDYWQHLDFEIINSLNEMLEKFIDRRLWFFSKKADQLYTEIQYRTDDLLVFGKETKGLPESLLAERPESCVRIPMEGKARSLNLATSVGVACYECIRQTT